MSVVAGCSLFDGILLTADCRATIQRQNRPDTHSDNVLKVIAISPNTAIGFVGHIDVAASLLHCLFIEIRKRKQIDPISLSYWIPRLFRYHFNRFTSKHGKRAVAFIIASALRGRPNIVERKTAVELVNHTLFSSKSIQRNWVPSFLLEFLKIPPNIKWIKIPNSSQNVLYTIKSPNFNKSYYPPLKYTAIGSGDSSLEQIELCHDSVLALDPGNSMIEGVQFRSIIQRFLYERKIESVGGLYPVLKVTGRGVEYIGMSTEIPIGGTKIELSFQSDRWVQRNVTKGKEIPILLPWEFMGNNKYEENAFDDLSDAMRAFKALD